MSADIRYMSADNRYMSADNRYMLQPEWNRERQSRQAKYLKCLELSHCIHTVLVKHRFRRILLFADPIFPNEG